VFPRVVRDTFEWTCFIDIQSESMFFSLMKTPVRAQRRMARRVVLGGFAVIELVSCFEELRGAREASLSPRSLSVAWWELHPERIEALHGPHPD
jgi:hypothetical protein